MTRLAMWCGGLLLLATQAQAQEMLCLPRERFLVVAERNALTVTGIGVNPGGIVELWQNAEMFALTISLPDGRTCVFVDGTGWETVAPQVTGRPS